MDTFAVWKQQRISHIEEDGFDFRIHVQGWSTSRSAVAPSTAFRE
jgi:hypothetical protein